MDTTANTTKKLIVITKQSALTYHTMDDDTHISHSHLETHTKDSYTNLTNKQIFTPNGQNNS